MKVSNSMMQSAQKCEKRFEFEHIYQIRPKSYPEAMERGIGGHVFMEEFFKRMALGGTYEECVEAVNLVLPQYIGHPAQNVYRHVLAWGAYVFQQKWKVVSVEISHIVELRTTIIRNGAREPIEFAFTADTVFEWTEGPRKGSQFMVDYKFTGQYWTDKELAVYQQLPKYVLYTNQFFPEDKPIRHAALVMLNTRSAAGATGNNLFLMKWLNVKKEKLAGVETENLMLAQQTAELRAGLEDGSRVAIRSVDTYGCKMCFFAEDICPAQLEGRDITKMIERNYIHNTYFDDNYADEPES